MILKAFRSLMLHRLRAILSTLGVLFGVVAVVAMLSIGEGAKQETLEQIEQLGVHNIVIRQQDLSEEQHVRAREKRSRGLTFADSEALAQAVPGLTGIGALKVVEGALSGTQKEINPEILAVTPAFQELKGVAVSRGRLLCALDGRGRSLVCVLGHETARQLGRYGHVGQQLRIENVPFQIVGVLSPRRTAKKGALSVRDLNKAILIPFGAHRSLPRQTSLKSDLLTEIHLKVPSQTAMFPMAQTARRVLDQAHRGVEDYQLIIPQELLHQAQQTQRTFNLVLGSIATISLLVGGIGIMNIMLATVSERTREIGIRRAVGANRRHILLQFMTETLLLTLTGALLGVLLGILFSWGISTFAGWTTIVKPWAIFLSLSMASTVGLCSGLYPALKATQMNPITALRHD